MSKKISLNISERIRVIDILNGFKGSLDKVAIVIEDIRPISITEEDWAKAERVITPAPTPDEPKRITWNWNDDKGGLKEFDLNSVTVEFLREFIKEKNDKGGFSLQDRPFITLQEKLA